ncbi:MAG: choice-of-anchor Q domain-containing protein, partial [Verrucomicrobiota bacterium]
GENTDAHPWFLPGTPNADGNYVGTTFAPLDPLLSPLQDNGGATLTRLPLEGSPAIDPAGGDMSSTFALDQRGGERVQNDNVDIGAVEVVFVPEPVVPVIDNSPLIASIEAKIRSLTKKRRNANRKKQVAKAKRLAKKIRRLKQQVLALQ